MRIFAEIEASQVFAARLQRAKAEVESLNQGSISQTDDEDHALRILSLAGMAPLRFRFDDVHISPREEMIPAKRHPSQHFFLERVESYLRQIIRYHLPFEGDPELLHCVPNPHILWSVDVDASEGEIAFDVVDWSGDPDDVNAQAEGVFRNIRAQHEHLSKQVNAFNASAQTQIMQLLSDRRAKLKKDSDFIAALGLPVKDSGSTPGTSRHPRSDSQARTPSMGPVPKANAS